MLVQLVNLRDAICVPVLADRLAESRALDRILSSGGIQPIAHLHHPLHRLRMDAVHALVLPRDIRTGIA